MPSKTVLAIAGLYDGIYLVYGPANSFLTCGLDRLWRAQAAKIAKKTVPRAMKALDACCGTGDFALALRRAFGGSLEITGSDLSAPMLSVAKAKYPDMVFVQAPAAKLPWPDDSFDLVSVAFAARNLNTDREALLAALREFLRVLKPGGALVTLETTRPANTAVSFLMRAYVNAVIGLLNAVAPKHSRAYAFLRHTIVHFYTAKEFSALLAEAGLTGVSHTILFPGAVAVHTARK